MDFYDYDTFYDFFFERLGKTKKLSVYVNGFIFDFDNIDEAQICLATLDALDAKYNIEYEDRFEAGRLQIRLHFNIGYIL